MILSSNVGRIQSSRPKSGVFFRAFLSTNLQPGPEGRGENDINLEKHLGFHESKPLQKKVGRNCWGDISLPTSVQLEKLESHEPEMDVFLLLKEHPL